MSKETLEDLDENFRAWKAEREDEMESGDFTPEEIGQDFVDTLDMIFGRKNVFVVDENTDFSESSEMTKRMKKLIKKGGDE